MPRIRLGATGPLTGSRGPCSKADRAGRNPSEMTRAARVRFEVMVCRASLEAGRGVVRRPLIRWRATADALPDEIVAGGQSKLAAAHAQRTKRGGVEARGFMVQVRKSLPARRGDWPRTALEGAAVAAGRARLGSLDHGRTIRAAEGPARLALACDRNVAGCRQRRTSMLAVPNAEVDLHAVGRHSHCSGAGAGADPQSGCPPDVRREARHECRARTAVAGRRARSCHCTA